MKKLWRDVKVGDRVVLTVMEYHVIGRLPSIRFVETLEDPSSDDPETWADFHPDSEVEVVDPVVVKAVAFTGDGREVPSTFQPGDTLEPFDGKMFNLVAAAREVVMILCDSEYKSQWKCVEKLWEALKVIEKGK